MTIIHVDQGYLKDNYLENDYLSQDVLACFGLQFSVTINEAKQAKGMQFTGQINEEAQANGLQFNGQISTTKAIGAHFLSSIVDFKKPIGVQFQHVFNDKANAQGLQFTGLVISSGFFGLQFSNQITKTNDQGLQFNAIINEAYQSNGVQFNSAINDAKQSKGAQFTAQVNYLKSHGIQFSSQPGNPTPTGTQFNIFNTQPKATGTQFFVTPHFHATGYYLTDSYLSDYYMQPAGDVRVHIPLQFRAVGLINHPSAVQFKNIIAHTEPTGLQFRGVVDKVQSKGVQFNSIKNELKASGIQFSNTINAVTAKGIQFRGVVSKLTAAGMQFTNVTLGGLSAQFRVALYNTNNLRVLLEFPSRGNGTNWTTNSQAVGDFDVTNLNSDIVEEVWRSATGSKTGINLICDTGLNQGAYIDTLAILNHNLTKNASVTVVGSMTPDFATIVQTILVTTETENSFYISPELPLTSARYWKFIIDDATNPNDYLQIGTIIFGSAIIFHGENYANPLRFKRTNYADGVETEGFSYVKNDRGIKRNVDIDFKSINFNGGNYKNMVEIFETARTTLKALWIPTPQYASRYAVFGKLSELPQEEHIDNGQDATYVTLTLNIDESK